MSRNQNKNFSRKQNDASVNFLYSTRVGRSIQNTMLFFRVPALLGCVLRSPISRFYVKPFIKKNNIDMTDFDGVKFRSFNDFFTRKKETTFDGEPSHLISPCDGMLSVYEITDESVFHIKGFDYTVGDLLGISSGDELVSGGDLDFSGGLCLIFRLRPIDYHRYNYIDSGKKEGETGKNHFIKGSLHSVQDAAIRRYKVFKKNRRSWTILSTENFGRVAQIEVGAFSVGGIINHQEEGTFKKGEEKGYFDLHGSTIALLFEKDRIKLNEEVASVCDSGEEFPVKCGAWLGTAV